MKTRVLLAAVLGIWLSLASVVSGAGKPYPPRKITVSAPLEGVRCTWWYCCGDVSVDYRGYWYATPFPGYCRVFGQLTEGERVVTTVVLRGR